MVYLIHFKQPIGNMNNPRGMAQHYLGSSNNLVQRLKAHQDGNGARLMEVVNEKNVRWWLARIWDGDRKLERELKNRHNSRKLCPICRVLENHHA